jgi:hypothetical protein
LLARGQFSLRIPNGDAGGNLVFLCAKPCKDELHAYWDGLLGDDLTINQVKQTGDRLLMAGTPEGTDDDLGMLFGQPLPFTLCGSPVFLVGPIGQCKSNETCDDLGKLLL